MTERYLTSCLPACGLAVAVSSICSFKQEALVYELLFASGETGLMLIQVVGTYSESASDEQNAALKQVALTKPDAPSLGELKKMGYDFALKV